MFHFTSIYGLTVGLNKRIPGIASIDSLCALPDVTVNFGTMPSWFKSGGIPKEIRYVSPGCEGAENPRLIAWNLPAHNYYQLRYADQTEFLIDNLGTEVWATWPEEVLTVEDTATYLLGPIMGFVLLLRGSVSLHASAIAIDDSAVAIVGPAGSGKSTTAAALANLGYPILAEDVVTLKDLGSAFLVQPAYPCIRLWPASVKALYGDDAELPRLTPTWDKCYLDLTSGQYQFEQNELPLCGIYLLANRSADSLAPRICSISDRAALLSLIANTYAGYLMDTSMRAREFELLGRLVSAVSVRKVVPHIDAARIGTLCQTITNDFEDLNLTKNSSALQDSSIHV